MTDLFDSLSDRFTPGAPIAIRPRPQSRFEAGNDVEGPVEEDGFDVVRAPETPKTAIRNAAPLAQPSSNTKATIGPSAISAPTETAAKDKTTLAAPTPPNHPNVIAQQSPTETHEVQIDKPDDPTPDLKTRQTAPAPTPSPPEAPSSKPEAIREIHRETTVKPAGQPQPIQTRKAPRLDRQPEPTPAPAHQEPNTVVRIGRVEMRQATPPPPPPKPPAPQRAANNGGSAGRSSGHGSSQSRGSGLTDYLGWKRK